jgi:hypothetical protein
LAAGQRRRPHGLGCRAYQVGEPLHAVLARRLRLVEDLGQHGDGLADRLAERFESVRCGDVAGKAARNSCRATYEGRQTWSMQREK